MLSQFNSTVPDPGNAPNGVSPVYRNAFTAFLWPCQE